MSAALCVDASVAAKWVLPEEGSDRALALRRDARDAQTEIVAPPHLPSEVANAAYKRYRTGALTIDEARAAMQTFALIPLRLVFSPALAERAVDLAASFGLSTPYDAFYLVVGEIMHCDVWTADARLYRAMHDRQPHLRLLADYGP